MGNWLFNYHVRTHDDAAVAQCMTELAEYSVVVGRAENGWTTVFEQRGVDATHQRRIARELSARLSAVVLTWEIADDDLTRCQLWDAGRRRLEFDSWPDYDGSDVTESVRRRKAGSPTILAQYCLEGTTSDAIKAALLQSDGHGSPFVMESERAHALAPLLGIDVDLAQASFEDVGEQPSLSSRLLRRIEGKRPAIDPRMLQVRRLLHAGEYETVLGWLRDGLDPNARDDRGADVVDAVLNERAWPVMRALVEAGIKSELFLHWCVCESTAELIWLIDHGANVHMLDTVGASALLRAAELGNCDAAAALIAVGADVNRQHHLTYRAPPRVIIGRTALMSAARGGDTAMVKLLLAKGADRTLKDADGWNARDFAISRNHLDLAALLS